MATHEPQPTLLRLSDTEFRLADPSEDVRGQKVLDMAGEELGSVDDLFIDDRDHKVRFLQITSGGFLGLGATKFLLPVDAIARLTADAVYIQQGREQVAGAPRYDPTLVDERYMTDVYSHYGYPPFWGLDYEYPPYPTYVPPARSETTADAPYVREAEATAVPLTHAQRGMQVKDVMTTQVEVVHPEASLWEAAQKMANLDVGPLPVCAGDQLVGMLTDRDITIRVTAEGYDPKTTRVHEVMTPDVLYVFADQDVDEAMVLMTEYQIRRLVVLNRDKQLVGIVSLGDLVVSTGDTVQAGETLERISEPAEPNR
jgi:CBS domain-containing protein/sporulation protein YlmC with PRC-barrel domain